jgi:hypothetical protein
VGERLQAVAMASVSVTSSAPESQPAGRRVAEGIIISSIYFTPGWRDLRQAHATVRRKARVEWICSGTRKGIAPIGVSGDRAAGLADYGRDVFRIEYPNRLEHAELEAEGAKLDVSTLG